MIADGVLVDPITLRALQLSGDGAWLINESDERRFPITNGIPQLLASQAQPLPKAPTPKKAATKKKAKAKPKATSTRKAAAKKKPSRSRRGT